MLDVNEPAAFAPSKSYEPLLHVSIPTHNRYAHSIKHGSRYGRPITRNGAQ